MIDTGGIPRRTGPFGARLAATVDGDKTVEMLVHLVDIFAKP